MMKFALVDPKVISKNSFESREYVKEAIFVLQALLENLRIVVDAEGNLIRQLEENICHLGNTGNKQKFKELFISILSQHRNTSNNKKFILAKDVRYSKKDCQSVTRSFYNELKAYCQFDTLIVGKEKDRSLTSLQDITEISQYSESTFEDNRRTSFRDEFRLEQYSRNELSQIFGRCLQYSKYLTLYDPYIAESAMKLDRNGNLKEGNWRSFLAGIDFILNSRTKGAAASNSKVVIISQIWKDKYSPDHHRILQSMIDTLSKKNSCYVEIHVKEKTAGVRFHDRFLETSHGTISFSAGFDLFSDAAYTKFQPQSVRISMTSGEELKKYRELRNIEILATAH